MESDSRANREGGQVLRHPFVTVPPQTEYIASRGVNHIRHLLDLIAQFPRINPSADDASSTLDIARLLRLIRSRYKALCSTLGVAPSMRALAAGAAGEDEKPEKPSVWALEKPQVQDMSF